MDVWPWRGAFTLRSKWVMFMSVLCVACSLMVNSGELLDFIVLNLEHYFAIVIDA